MADKITAGEASSAEDLAIADRRLRGALQASSSVIWEWDVATARVLLGEPAREGSWEELLHPEERAVVLRALEDHARGSTRTFDLVFRVRLNGEWRRVQARGQGLERDATGRSAFVSGIFTALSERTDPDQPLLTSNGTPPSIYWNDASEHARALSLQDTQGRVLSLVAARAPLSEVLRALVLGIEEQNSEMIGSVQLLDESGKHIRNGAAPNLPPDYNALVDGHAIGPRAGSCGTAMFRRARVIVADTFTDPLWADYVAITAKFGLRACWSEPIFSQSGRLLGTFAMYYRQPRAPSARDIGLIEIAARLAAIAIALTEADIALHKSEERLSLALEAARMGTWDWNIQTGAIAWSNSVATLFGIPHGEFAGTFDAYLELLPSEDRAPMKQVIDDAVAGRTIDFTGQHRVPWPDGSVHWLEGKGRVYRDAAGDAVRMAGTVTDISARKQAEEALRGSEDQLRQAQKMEAVGRLAGGIAHDFNNLLMVIDGSTQVSLKLVPAESPVHAYLLEIRRASERAASLTRQLLAFSRKQKLTLKVLDLNTVVVSFGQLLRRVIGEDVQLSTRLAPDIGLIKADSGQIEQVIMNLVVNSRDAMPKGGKLTLETANVECDRGSIRKNWPSASGSFVTLVVGDTGSGMDAETQSHIFEPFFTTKETGKGTGLGLSTVYGIIEQFGGHVEVQSEVGSGTTFTIYLPRVDEMASASTPATSATRSSIACETILVVEDERIVRSLVLNALESQGYRVLAAEDGRKALEIQKSHVGSIDLLVTDVVMPHISGPELAERIRPLHPEMRVLYMSGYTSDADVGHGAEGSPAAFLQKPFDLDTLVSTARELLDRRAEKGS